MNRPQDPNREQVPAESVQSEPKGILITPPLLESEVEQVLRNTGVVSDDIPYFAKTPNALSGISRIYLPNLGVTCYEIASIITWSSDGPGAFTRLAYREDGSSWINGIRALPGHYGILELDLAYEASEMRDRYGGKSDCNALMAKVELGDLCILKIIWPNDLYNGADYDGLAFASVDGTALRGYVLVCNRDRIPVMKAALIKIGKEDSSLGNVAFALFKTLEGKHDKYGNGEYIISGSSDCGFQRLDGWPIPLLQALDEAVKKVRKSDIIEATLERAKEVLYSEESYNRKTRKAYQERTAKEAEEVRLAEIKVAKEARRAVRRQKIRSIIPTTVRGRIAAAGLAALGVLGGDTAPYKNVSEDTAKLSETTSPKNIRKESDIKMGDTLDFTTLEEGIEKGFIVITKDKQMLPKPGYDWANPDDPGSFSVIKGLRTVE